jgi:hypothetical protein
MGWNLRRSVNLGPLRINISKSGVGYSVGIRGLRVGKDAARRTYSSLSIPGTGIYRRDYLSNARPPVVPLPTPTSPVQNPAPPRRISSVAVRWVLCIGGAVLIYAIIRAIT